jgi:hypothetical protein
LTETLPAVAAIIAAAFRGPPRPRVCRSPAIAAANRRLAEAPPAAVFRNCRAAIFHARRPSRPGARRRISSSPAPPFGSPAASCNSPAVSIEATAACASAFDPASTAFALEGSARDLFHAAPLIFEADAIDTSRRPAAKETIVLYRRGAHVRFTICQPETGAFGRDG